MRSAFSETVTRSGTIEYNVIAVTQAVKLIFCKDTSVAPPVHLDEIQIKMTTQMEDLQLEDKLLDMAERGEKFENIFTDDDDDIRILDSLPQNLPGKSDALLVQLLLSIEILGFNLSTIPAITNLTYFMNQAFHL